MSATGRVWREIAAQRDPGKPGSCEATRALRNIEQVIGLFGVRYTKGADMAKHLEALAAGAGDISKFRGPVFADDDSMDEGASVGFRAELGISPDQPLDSVVGVIMERFGLQARLVPVIAETELFDDEKFMSGRLPGVRVCIVCPASSCFQAPLV